MDSFPIKSNTACQLKWTWSTILLRDGCTSSCHRVQKETLTPENFKDFHNTPKKIADRKLMLEGKWPGRGCEYCKNIEQAGGQSDRQFQIQIPGLVPKELHEDSSAVSVTPRILEIYFDNTCNMSCVYCYDGFSSMIEKENNKFGPFQHNTVNLSNISKKPAVNLEVEFWNWMNNNAHELRRLHVLGGEPFFQPQLNRCLEFFESTKLPELEFNIITNLKVPFNKLTSMIERMKLLCAKKKLARIDITCSIDCWGAEQEYIRHGLNLTQWQENFQYLCEQKWLTLNINQTITGIGMKSMPGLLNYINEQRKNRKIGHYFMACVNRPYLYPGIFGKNFWDKEFEEILSIMPSDSWQHQQAKNMMEGLQKEFNSQEKNPALIEDLKVFLDEIDRRRNLDWKTTFPWLTKI